MTGGTFKKRWDRHNFDFRHETEEGATKLSGYIWKLKKRDIPYSISWEKIQNSRVFNPVNKKCKLCLNEKYQIMFHREGASLNSRKELFTTCRHRKQKLLQNYKWDSDYCFFLCGTVICLLLYFYVLICTIYVLFCWWVWQKCHTKQICTEKTIYIWMWLVWFCLSHKIVNN